MSYLCLASTGLLCGTLASHFDGAQPYGRADDFLGELLLQAPSMKQLDDERSNAGGDVLIGLIDRHRVAEDIILPLWHRNQPYYPSHRVGWTVIYHGCCCVFVAVQYYRVQLVVSC